MQHCASFAFDFWKEDERGSSVLFPFQAASVNVEPSHHFRRIWFLFWNGAFKLLETVNLNIYQSSSPSGRQVLTETHNQLCGDGLIASVPLWIRLNTGINPLADYHPLFAFEVEYANLQGAALAFQYSTSSTGGSPCNGMCLEFNVECGFMELVAQWERNNTGGPYGFGSMLAVQSCQFQPDQQADKAYTAFP